MILRGILDRSLSNQLCIRGFASIKELARISKADYTYQRDLYGEQEDIVKRFLENETYLFFPEVILSYKFKHKGDSSTNPLRKIKDFEREGKTIKAKSNIDKTLISLKKLDYSGSDTRGKESLQVVELVIDDENLRTLIEANNHPFHRIDGNHRLTVAQNSDSPIVNNMTIPFCIILGDEYYKGKNEIFENEDSKVFEKSIRVYFHNINTKTLPLSSEQNLKVLIDDGSNFSEDELDKIFPQSGNQIREFVKKIDINLFNGIENILNNNLRNVLNAIFKLIANTIDDSKYFVDDVLSAFKAIEQLYINDKRFKNNENESLFISLVYFYVKNSTQFDHYLRWVTNNHLFEVEEERAESIVNTYRKAESIINIYNKIYEKKTYKIFVAMPYWSHSEINEYNKLYKEICIDVSKKANVELELIPIMRFRGKSQRIDQRLLDKIKECDIFIADITGNNINVIFEIGFAESRDLPMILLKNEKDEKTVVPFDMDKLQYLPYPDKGYYNDIKLKVSGNLIEILKKEFNLIF
jgi:hypothetical protein